MKSAPTGVAKSDGTYDPPRHGWTCFHCGEEFSIQSCGSHARAVEAATEHFGPDPRWRPGCVELLKTKPVRLWKRLRAAEIKLAAMPELQEQVDFLSRAGTERDALRNEMDSLKGELLVLQESLA